MRLSELLCDQTFPAGLAQDTQITGLTADSRHVRPGYVFAAFQGDAQNGADFVDDAKQRGACLVLAGAKLKTDLPVLITQKPRLKFAKLAARFFEYMPPHIVAVTGTNGKTSVAEFYRQIATHLSVPAASLGTMGLIAPTDIGTSLHTTPDPVALHQLLRDLYFAGVTHLAMEASSHGLDQYRMDGVVPKAAAFTNITREHLDYHKTEKAYLAAKARLFTDLLDAQGQAVVNIDGAGAEDLLSLIEPHVGALLKVGTHEDADLRAFDIEQTPHGLQFQLAYAGTLAPVQLALVGGFQVENILCAVGLALATGFDFQDVVSCLPNLIGATGRMEKIGLSENGAAIFVDYAHTPDALEKALTHLRPHCAGQLICVFGCGGDRDAGKRPQMGAVAAKHADVVIVTDDNPRHEEPSAIRAEILAACPNAQNIGNRGAAIAEAMAQAQAGDLVLVAGKGHEIGQIIGDNTITFSDHHEIRKNLRRGAA